ncbi:MAG TPA: hypothetical protein VNQ77_19760 [Frankiaceae bacterium]|nr:hypothetical protein [Frankiaceae bacterium]
MSDIDIARDDLALDALAAGLVPDTDDEALLLLGALRTDLDLPAQAPDVVPLRRKPRRLAAVALSAAAGLILGGMTAGAVVTSDQPGELFYAAHKAVLGDPRASERVTKLLDEAQEELDEGDRRGAIQRLDKAGERLGDVEDPVAREALRARLDRLRAIAAAPAPPPQPRESSGSDDDSSGTGSGSDDDSSGSGSGSDDSDSSGSGSGSDDSTDDSGSNSSSGSSGSGSGDSGSDSSGKGSGNSGSGSDDD